MQHTESCRRQLFPSKEIERWIELGNLVLHLSGCCRVAGRGPTSSNVWLTLASSRLAMLGLR